MGLLALKRLMSVQQRERRRRRRRGRIRDAKVALLANGKDSTGQQDGSPQGHKSRRYSGPDLPEDIWRHIHFLMPLEDAARAACVCHAFLSSWRCRPDITISWRTLGLDKNFHGKGAIAKVFNSIVDQILKNRSGIGLKALKLDFYDYKAETYSYLNNWLEIAITPELEELTLDLLPCKAKYSFPCSLLSNGRGNSIRHLKLVWCTFSNTVGLDCLKNLTSLHLSDVHITGNELGCLFFSSSALERLELHGCHRIVRLEIPCLLKRLWYLGVFACDRLKVIESKAPNISSVHLLEIPRKLSLGESSLRLKDMMLNMNRSISFARAELPFMVPNLKSLTLASSGYEAPNTPLVSKTFLHLKYLYISLSEGAFSPYHDCFSAASFLDAAPSLETLRLGVTLLRMKHEPFVGEPSPQNQIMGIRHSNLKSVKITGFCSAKSLVELTCYILEIATSLDCLTLDTTWGCYPRCSHHGISKCHPLDKDVIRDSQNALLVIRAWIEGKVPPTVKFNVLAHCSKCHNADED